MEQGPAKATGWASAPGVSRDTEQEAPQPQASLHVQELLHVLAEGPGGCPEGQSPPRLSGPPASRAHVSSPLVVQRRIFTVVPGALADHERPSNDGRSME